MWHGVCFFIYLLCFETTKVIPLAKKKCFKLDIAICRGNCAELLLPEPENVGNSPKMDVLTPK